MVAPEDFRGWVAAVKQGQASGGRNLPLLDWAKFEALIPQTTDNPVTYYASIEPDLFSRDVRKYMPHYQMKPLPDRVQFDEGLQSAPEGVVQPNDHGAVPGHTMTETAAVRQER